MAKNLFILISSFFFLVMLETSFLVNFHLAALFFSPVLIVILLLNLFRSSLKLGLGSALAGGFFLDIFSSAFMGFWIVILLVASLFIQYILKRYIHLPLWKNI